MGVLLVCVVGMLGVVLFILRAVFCIICSLLVSDALGDHMVEAYSSTGLVMAFYVTSLVSLDFEYVDCFACFGCGQVYVSVVSEFVVKCES